MSSNSDNLISIRKYLDHKSYATLDPTSLMIQESYSLLFEQLILQQEFDQLELIGNSLECQEKIEVLNKIIKIKNLEILNS